MLGYKKMENTYERKNCTTEKQKIQTRLGFVNGTDPWECCLVRQQITDVGMTHELTHAKLRCLVPGFTSPTLKTPEKKGKEICTGWGFNDPLLTTLYVSLCVFGRFWAATQMPELGRLTPCQTQNVRKPRLIMCSAASLLYCIASKFNSLHLFQLSLRETWSM